MAARFGVLLALYRWRRNTAGGEEAAGEEEEEVEEVEEEEDPTTATIMQVANSTGAEGEEEEEEEEEAATTEGTEGRGTITGDNRNEGNDGQTLDWEEDEEVQVFSRRKLQSNWDRYLESEREEPTPDDTPTVRGTDYHVLLESAGDSFTQFRFSEEKDWEMDSVASSQMAAVRLDLVALAQCLQALPLHQRLNLEAELVQVSHSPCHDQAACESE
ncbi:hypothetical protein CRUP_012929 [Coryphaenoides rupestris]|nr:hypothetical protein CRUP_012929 [Coryphaenoides rupestris]